MRKRGAVELSFSTIVILVLAMTMLILGLVLVRSIFTGAKYNVDSLNDKVKGEIGTLFSDDDSRKIVVYLSDSKATIKKGENYGVSFGVKNLGTGIAASRFTYEVFIDTNEEDLRNNCGITGREALSYIAAGKTGSMAVSPNEVELGLIRINIPKDGPVCLFRYRVEVKKENVLYDDESFDVQIK